MTNRRLLCLRIILLNLWIDFDEFIILWTFVFILLTTLRLTRLLRGFTWYFLYCFLIFIETIFFWSCINFNLLNRLRWLLISKFWFYVFYFVIIWIFRFRLIFEWMRFRLLLIFISSFGNNVASSNKIFWRIPFWPMRLIFIRVVIFEALQDLHHSQRWWRFFSFYCLLTFLVSKCRLLMETAVSILLNYLRWIIAIVAAFTLRLISNRVFKYRVYLPKSLIRHLTTSYILVVILENLVTSV